MPTPPPSNPPPILAIILDATELAQALLDVLTREAEALKVMKLQAPTGFADAKTRLVTAYGYKLEELQETPMAEAARPALDTLRALNEKVLEAARLNAAALEGAMDGNRRLMDILLKAVEEQRTPTTVGYARAGNRPAAPRTGDRSVPMMVTRKL